MSPESIDKTPEPEAGLSEASRLGGVLLEPGTTFRDIALRPSWITPIVVMIVCGLAFTFAFTQKVGWERFMRQQVEKSSRAAQMTPEQREQAIAMQSRMGPVMGYAGSILAPPLLAAIIGGVLMLCLNGFCSAELKFKQAMAVVSYARLPAVIFMLLAVAVMFLKNPDDFDMRNPLLFNLGAFFDPNSGSKFLRSLATSFDLFTFWEMALMAVGFAAAGRRLAFGTALSVIFSLWLAVALVGAGFASMFG